MGIILGAFVSASYPALVAPLDERWDRDYVIPSIADCNNGMAPDQRAVLKFYQFCASQYVFGNPKIIPFAESIGLVILSYLITCMITKARYAGLMASAVLVSSAIFSQNAAMTSFSEEWAFFLMSALYLSFRRPELAGPLYFLSFFAKGITLLYAPFLIYMIISSKSPKRARAIAVSGIVLAIVVAAIWTVYVGNNILQTQVPIGFQSERNIWIILANPLWNFTGEKQDQPMLFFFIPVTGLGLYLLRRIPEARGMLYFMVYLFSLQILIPMFSGYGMGDYRNVPLIFIVSVGFAMFVHFRLDIWMRAGYLIINGMDFVGKYIQFLNNHIIRSAVCILAMIVVMIYYLHLV